VVIFPGRTEPTIKYAELISDLLANGYSTYAMDLRGQGASGRMLAEHDKGYVRFFADYVADAQDFIQTVVLPEEPKNVFIAAHSTGGAIAALLVDEHPEWITAMAFSAPMFELVTGKYPAPVAVTLANAVCSGTDATGYATGGDYVEGEFATNSLSSSADRFEWKYVQMREAPQLRLGGPTFRWLCEALAAGGRAQALGRYSPVPTLILQAENDTTVLLPAQARSCSDAPRCQLSLMPGAKHELFQETDAIRNLAVSQVLKFFAARANP
jgi:lysophospholipase